MIKTGERSCNSYLNILAELAYCCKNISNPKLAQQLKQDFKFILDLEIKRDYLDK